jgi:hypothetical protein
MTESLDASLVDRLWEAWMAVRRRLYRPTAQDPDASARHRLDDVMTTPLGDAVRLTQVLDPSRRDTYDTLAHG